MANNSTNRTVNIYIESGEAQKALDALLKKEESLKKALADAMDPAAVNKLKESLTALKEPMEATKTAAKEAKKIVSDLLSEEKSLLDQLKQSNNQDTTKGLQAQLEKVGFLLENARRKSAEANQALAAIGKQEQGLQAALAKATDPKQVERLTAELKKLEEPLERARRKASGELAPSLRELEATAQKIRQEFKNMSEGDAGFDEMRQKWDKANKQLDEQRGKMGLLQKAMKSFWAEAKTVAVGVIVGNTVQSALQTVMSQITGMVTGSAKIADELADIEKTTNLSSADVIRLNKELSKINTRTGSADLRKLAEEAGKLGKDSVEDVRKFVEQADIINVALGEDLGEGAITSLGKLSKIFKVEMINIGSAINEVGAKSEASESFAVDFLNRLAGTGPAVKLTADQLIGYGAALEIAGQTAEVSGTSLSNFFIDFTRDTEKFGQAAGFANGELTKLVTEKGTNEGFIQFLTRLKAANPEAKDFLTKMQQLGVDGSRGANVMLALSNNIQGVRVQQEIANGAIQNGNSILNEFNKKNNNAAAELDKFKKNFASLFASDTVREAGAATVRMLNNLVNVLKGIPKFVDENKAALISMGVVYTLLRLKVIGATIAKAADLVISKQQALATQISVAADLIHAYWIDYKTKKINLATFAQKSWNTVTALGPGIIFAMVAAIGILAYAITKAVTKNQELTNSQKLQSEIAAKVAESTSEAIEKVRQLTAVAKDQNLSLDARNKALNELIALNPKYFEGLKLEHLLTQKGTDLINGYTDSLKKKAEVEAQAAALSEAIKKREIAFATIKSGLKAKGVDVDDAQIEKLVRDGAKSDDRNNIGGIRLAKSITFGVDNVEVTRALDVIQELQSRVDANNKKIAEDAVRAAGVANSQAVTIKKSLLDQLDSIEKLEERLKADQQERDTTGDASRRSFLNKEIKDIEGRIRNMRGEADKLSSAAKKQAKDFKSVAEELRKMAAELLGESFVQDLEELNIKFDKLRERAAGNSKLLLQVEELYQKELSVLRRKWFDKTLQAERDRSAAEKAEFERIQKQRVDLLLAAQARMLERLALETSRGVDNQRAKKELEIERAFLLKKAKLQKEALDKEELDEIEALKKKYDIKAGEEYKIQGLIDQVHDKFRKKRFDADITTFQAFLSFAQQAATILGAFSQNKNEKENAELERDRKNNDKKKQNLDKRLKAGTLSQQQYDREIQKIEKAQERREKELRLKQFKRQQKADLIQALINGGLAVTETLAKFGPPIPPNIAGMLAMAFTVAASAAAIGGIAGRQAPEFGRGGRLGGPSHSDPSHGLPVTDPYTGRVHAYMEGGEGIANKHSMADGRHYQASGTVSQIISGLNAMHGGVHWETGATIRPMWSTQRPAPVNYTALSSSIGTARRMYADGGVFNGQGAAPGGSGANEQLLQLIAQNSVVMAAMHGTLSRIQSEGIYAYTMLSDQRKQAARYDDIRKQSTMR
jgi:TP901 family phage tail tape measure protein